MSDLVERINIHLAEMAKDPLRQAAVAPATLNIAQAIEDAKKVWPVKDAQVRGRTIVFIYSQPPPYKTRVAIRQILKGQATQGSTTKRDTPQPTDTKPKKVSVSGETKKTKLKAKDIVKAMDKSPIGSTVFFDKGRGHIYGGSTYKQMAKGLWALLSGVTGKPDLEWKKYAKSASVVVSSEIKYALDAQVTTPFGAMSAILKPQIVAPTKSKTTPQVQADKGRPAKIPGGSVTVLVKAILQKITKKWGWMTDPIEVETRKDGTIVVSGGYRDERVPKEHDDFYASFGGEYEVDRFLDEQSAKFTKEIKGMLGNLMKYVERIDHEYAEKGWFPVYITLKKGTK